ncbi:MAG: class I SAM-dependent methyltransferase [Acidobacteria bacterium]|nr:class I SAM-dependent methyltransferase [Acidobacteriota bacterium]
MLAGVTQAPAFQLGSRATKEWIERLERPERLAGLKTAEVLARLKLKPGDVVADIGAGAGAFSRPLARAVAPGGKVLAVDVDQGLLDYIDQRAKQEKIENIQTVLGKFDDPNLPTRQVDLAFFHDVLHHIEHRQAYLKALASYLKPDGRIALIELDKDYPKTPHRDQPEMLVSMDQVKQWMTAAGFEPVEKFDLFEDKWFVMFGRKAEEPSEAEHHH